MAMNFEKLRKHVEANRLTDEQLKTVPQLLQELVSVGKEGGPKGVTEALRKKCEQVAVVFEKCLEDVRREAGVS
jgi:hypothetical protein